MQQVLKRGQKEKNDESKWQEAIENTKLGEKGGRGKN